MIAVDSFQPQGSLSSFLLPPNAGEKLTVNCISFLGIIDHLHIMFIHLAILSVHSVPYLLPNSSPRHVRSHSTHRPFLQVRAFRFLELWLLHQFLATLGLWWE